MPECGCDWTSLVPSRTTRTLLPAGPQGLQRARCLGSHGLCQQQVSISSAALVTLAVGSGSFRPSVEAGQGLPLAPESRPPPSCVSPEESMQDQPCLWKEPGKESLMHPRTLAPEELGCRAPHCPRALSIWLATEEGGGWGADFLDTGDRKGMMFEALCAKRVRRPWGGDSQGQRWWTLALRSACPRPHPAQLLHTRCPGWRGDTWS